MADPIVHVVFPHSTRTKPGAGIHPLRSNDRKGGGGSVIASLFPQVRPTTASVTKTDLAPSTDASSCGVCTEAAARYVCPRCSIAYCSLACYKSHSEACTETFHERKVGEVMELEAKAKRKDTMEMLNRLHLNERGDADGGTEEFDEEELERILDAIEQGKDDVETLLSPEMKRAFQRAVDSGELTKSVLMEWEPWWEPNYTRGKNNTQSDLDKKGDDGAAPESSATGPSLDERLLRYKPLAATPKPSRLLQYHLVDILYAIAATLRSFQGVDNAKRLAPIEAATILLSCSEVLHNDARYESVANVLMNCKSVESIRTSVLLHDVCLLWKSRRHVRHALLDAVDIIRCAEKDVATLVATNGTEPANPATDTDIVDKRKLRRVRKKLEYFLSWSRSSSDIGENTEVLDDVWTFSQEMLMDDIVRLEKSAGGP